MHRYSTIHVLCAHYRCSYILHGYEYIQAAKARAKGRRPPCSVIVQRHAMHQVVTPLGLDRRRTRHYSVSHALVHGRTLALVGDACTGLASKWEKMNLAACPVLDRAQTFGEYLVCLCLLASESLLSLVPFSSVVSPVHLSLFLSLPLFSSLLLSCQNLPCFIFILLFSNASQKSCGVAWLPRRCFRGPPLG